jgi:hypothetical protein
MIAALDEAERDGKTPPDAIKPVLLELLTSKHFLYRVEAIADNESVRARSYPLAARLSFFLWRSLPDRELLALAENATLENDLESQVGRMLRDQRADAFIRVFAASWLGLSKLDDVVLLEPFLRTAMRQETEEFMAEILRKDRSVLDLLDADFTYVNERLAKHYGIQGVRGLAPQRVTLNTAQRGGLLTHGSILNLTSNDSETSPVNRGKWVLETLLGAEPIRPPVGILQALQTAPNNLGTGTPRQLLEVHRANPSCAQCHWKMDAIGMALENFDARGAWRTHWHAAPVDSLGVLPGGEKLTGLADVKSYLLEHREQFVLAMSEALLRQALGRKLTNADRSALASIPQTARSHEYRISQIISAVVLSEPFRR